MDTLDPDKVDRLCELFLQTVHQFEQLEKEMHTFGTEQKLHFSETHTIVEIGNHDHINVTKLAKLQGVSRSAASQMVSRLVKKGFVRKEVSPETENEVTLSLTEEGEQVRQWHERQHRWLSKKLAGLFMQYPDTDIAQLESLMVQMQVLWKSVPDQPE